jgi:hypothetical protein
MAAEPDQIRNDIKATRADLASNVDQLADRTSPSRIESEAERRLTDKLADSELVEQVRQPLAESASPVGQDLTEGQGVR